jgi:small redox-active disulfide protein 2
MKTIQVLGTGCPSCRLLAEMAEQAARELQIAFELEKITEIERIIALGAVATPALVVDGEIKCCGRIPSMDELKELLR